jgi:hypothetical protein
MGTSANFQEPCVLDASRDQFASCHLVSGSREIEMEAPLFLLLYFSRFRKRGW